MASPTFVLLVLVSSFSMLSNAFKTRLSSRRKGKRMIPTIGTLVVTDKISLAASCYTCQALRPDEELHMHESGHAVGAIAGRLRLR